ncbi:DNA-processing protein DprA [Trueperella bialowiezensis]|uniref:DNA protecting protein DprA n=1 Tax=Trueperella bialowiezensis TaxID=312285 RepID=A0A448PCN1_9ACTO|nr:DNA-processing protein DprA [Trueperella bialowiezensis]VEI12686.1 DNA protecting protein DprA [Trueperella bialowiezensis]
MDNRLARIEWSRITEGADQAAHGLIARLGAAASLEAVRSGEGLTPDEEQVARRWRHRLDGLSPFREKSLAALGITVLAPEDELWPEQINDLGAETPLLLWVKGNPEVLSSRPAVAIVGSRAATADGKRIARDFACDISDTTTVVSGGAFGIDAAAHGGALLAEKPTVIVSAGGADRVYPRAHEALFAAVLDGEGAVVSESPIGAAPQRFRFLARNRIIAALARATLVVEAPVRSGALSTARHAMKIGRDVGAVPGQIDSIQSHGCIDLLRNGATAIASADHLRELVGPFDVQPTLAADFFSFGAADDFDLRTARTFDAVPVSHSADAHSIASVAGLTVAETLTALGKLTLGGHVEENRGRWRRSRIKA